MPIKEFGVGKKIQYSTTTKKSSFTKNK